MNKVVFTLAGVSAICACGLVIDPDKLIEGNGASETPDATTDASTTDTSAPDAGEDATFGDASLDGPDGGTLIVNVPECVPTKPPGAVEGPYAVVFADATAPTPACPAGYLASPVALAKTDFEASAAACGDPSGCTCATSAGSVTCGFLVRYYQDSQCTKVADSPNGVGTTCVQVDSENYLKLEVAVGGFACTQNGPTTTSPTAKPTPTYKTQYVVCAPDPNVQLAQCKTGEVALPAAASAAACVIVPTTHSCPATGYGAVRLLSKSGSFTDTRTCTCGCGQSPASCTGGSVTTYDDDLGCSANPSALTVGACRARDSADNMIGVLPTAGTAACTSTATPNGEAAPAIDLKLCCLGTGGGG